MFDYNYCFIYTIDLCISVRAAHLCCIDSCCLLSLSSLSSSDSVPSFPITSTAVFYAIISLYGSFLLSKARTITRTIYGSNVI